METVSDHPSPAATTPIASRVFWSTLSGATGLVASIASMLAVSRLVVPDEFGRVAVILATWGILLNPITWCGSLVMRFGPVELAESGTLARTLATRLVLAIPVLVLLLAAVPLWCGLRLGWSAWLIALTEGWLVASTAYDLLMWSATATQGFRALAVGNLLVKGAPLIAIATTVIHPYFVTAEVLVAATVCGLVASSVAMFVALRRILAFARPDRELLRRMWRYSRPGLVGMPALAAISWLDPLLLDRWAAKADVGRYQLAYPTITIFAVVGVSLNGVLSPELVRSSVKDPATIDSYKRESQPRIAILLGIAGFGAACIAPSLVGAVVPARYAMTADVVGLLAVAGGFILGTYTLYPLVTATDSVWSQQIAYMLQAVTNVALDVLLAPRYGALGVGLANIAAWGVAFGTLTLLLRRTIDAPIRPLLPLFTLGPAVAWLLMAGVPVIVRLAVGAALLAIAGRLAHLFLRRRRAPVA